MAAGPRVDYVIVDEAQFLGPDQVEQLADLVDGASVDVYAFGISHRLPRPAVPRLAAAV